MTKEEKEYMDYLIHNRTELTNQITKHLDSIELLEKKLDIAVKALQYYVNKDKWDYSSPHIELFYSTKNGWYYAQKALKEIDSLEKCDKSHFFPSENVEGLK